MLRAAAGLTGETLTGFMLAAATERAEEVMARARRIEVPAISAPKSSQRRLGAIRGQP